MQIQLEFLKRQDILRIGLEGTAIGIYMKKIQDTSETVNYLSKKDIDNFDAWYSFPVLINENNIKQIRDIYLYNVGKRLKEQGQLLLNIQGRSSVAPGITIELVAEKEQNYIKLITKAGSILFFPLTQTNDNDSVKTTGGILSADVSVAVGDGNTLGGISNILDAKAVVIVRNPDAFSQSKGVQDILHKKKVVINMDKLVERDKPEIIFLD